VERYLKVLPGRMSRTECEERSNHGSMEIFNRRAMNSWEKKDEMERYCGKRMPRIELFRCINVRERPTP
jgi:hypothetical protein